MSNNALLTVDDLGISFRTERGINRAVEHISFDVYAGKTVAIVGESGSGKSVSSLSVMQLLNKNRAIFDSGRFLFDTSITPIEELQPTDEVLSELRGKHIAMIFQEPMTSLNPVMTCGEQVAEMLRQHKSISYVEARQRTIELFNEVKLPRAEEMFDQYPHQLSGGQRQRVMIAMAISCEPKILIADEPTTALDVTVQSSILELLRSLQSKYNMGMIFITHDLGVVADIADDIVVMQRGKIVEKGNAKDVLTNPQHPYTKGLLACRPVMGQKVARLKTVSDFLETNAATELDTFPAAPSNFIHDEVILDVKNLFKIYESSQGIFSKKKSVVKAVNDVSLQIHKGETLGLVGESGCGKTTLSRMLLGLIPASEGQIIFNGKDLCSLSKSELREMRKEMQIIFQDPYSSLNPKHTIGDSIMEPMMTFGLFDSYKKREQKAIELLEKTGLGAEHLKRYPHEFSGGQRQRIVIARALACEPSFVVCDEAVSALDVSVQAQVLNLLNDLKRDFALTYLFISHDLSVVYHISDRIMVMNKGAVEEIGTYDEVFLSPKSEYTKRLLKAVPGSSLNRT
ncbi:MAG TPA: ABC transporter ATP-binding protein [Flavobacteriales bacterium]